MDHMRISGTEPSLVILGHTFLCILISLKVMLILTHYLEIPFCWSIPIN